jgi:AraC-like DNA-binding protein
MYQEIIPWIKGTPLGLKIREIEFVPPHMHDDIIEIIFCLKGSVRFNYEYEQFTLHEGEFISVDKDAHYLYAGKDDICVSFYIDLSWFKERFPFISSLLFVCEYTRDSTSPKRQCHERLKGILIALLFFIGNSDKDNKNFQKVIISSVEKIVDLFIDCFDIIFFYNPTLTLKPELMERHHNITRYMQSHCSEKITLDTMSEEFYLAKSYISAFLRKVDSGFENYLGYMRAYRSEKLLLSTDMNITDISEACGFSDPKYYYDTFRKWYRCTPRQFRKSYTNKMKSPCLDHELNIRDAFDALDNLMLHHYMDVFLYN